MNIDLSEMFDYNLGARPATFSGQTIAVAFSRDQSQSFNTQNAAPTVWARTIDVSGISNNSEIVIHYGYLQAEDGSPILAEDGSSIIAENEFTYKVKGFHSDAFGVTVMELSLVSPRTT